MAIYHDAYPFYPDKFVAQVFPYLAKLHMSGGYGILRDKAIAVYDSNTIVQAMCLEYGGWDKNAILTQISIDGRDGLDDIAFWIDILLYFNLATVRPHQYGLGNYWRIMPDILTEFGWTTVDINLLVRGNSFTTLTASPVHPVWQSISSFGVSSSAGWIGRQEIDEFWTRLIKVKDVVGELDTIRRQNYMGPLQSALEMIAMARKRECGLCMLASG